VPLEIQNGIIARYELEMHNNKGGEGKENYKKIMSVYPKQVRELFADLQNSINNHAKTLN